MKTVMVYVLMLSLLFVPPSTYSTPSDYLNKEKFEYVNIIDWHNAGYTGKGVKVVINDVGEVDFNAPFFDSTKLNDPKGNVNKRGANSHAQNVAQIIHQIAPEAEIYFVKGNISNAINVALDENAQIINRSMSFNHGHLFKDNIKTAYNNDVLIVGSSGNTGKSPTSYGKYDEIVDVGAVVFDNKKELKRTYYSSYGPGLDVMGFSAILVNKNNKDYDSKRFSGTSASAPFVSGMLALYYEYYKEQYGRFPTVDETMDFISKNTIDLEAEGYDEFTGYGLLVLPELK